MGAPLGVLALGLLFWLFWKEKRKPQSGENEGRLSMHPLVGNYNGESDRGPDASAVKDQRAYYMEHEGVYQPAPRARGPHELANRGEIPELSQ